jgi:acetylornithine deacetylase
MGLDGAPGGVPFGSDASKLSRQGVPSLVFGPGSIDRAHGAVEYVEIDEVLKAEAFFREFLRRFE